MVFRDLKCYLVSHPILSKIELEEDLYMHLAVFNHAVSAVLLRYQDGIQRSMYYISKMLVDLEIRYLPPEKMALVSVHATRKFPHYFQAHTVWVLIEYPLQLLLRKSDFTERIAK